ncbi:MAG: hypothetical protein JEZ08_15390 [Clostridiales bacterium]|nr:hypothetical protein [Clostridiales bacterium]
MIKELENCHSIYLLKEKKQSKEDMVLKAQAYIKDCELRIKQLEFEGDNQMKFNI